MNRRWKQALVAAGLSVTAFVGFGGFLHTSAGRPLLRRLGGCPVGKVSPVIVQTDRDGVVQSQRGAAPAPVKEAFGFALRSDDLKSVSAWAKSKKLDCEERKEATVLYCTNVPTSVVDATAPAGDVLPELVFGFRVETKKLESVETFRNGLTPAQATAHMIRIRERLRTRMGVPGSERGAYDVGYMSKPYSTITLQYRYSDLLIDVYSTNIAGSGATVREQYMSGLAGS